MNTIFRLTPVITAMALLASCQKADSVTPISQPLENGQPKMVCDTSTVEYTEAAPIGTPWTSSGKLRQVWGICPGYGPSWPFCWPGGKDVILDYVTTFDTDNELDPWTNYPDLTYAQQRQIIDFAKAAALAARPPCPAGGLMGLVDLDFTRDAFVPTAFSIWARYECCQ